MGFLKFIVRPTYEKLAYLLRETLQGSINNLENNYLEWEKI